MHRYNHAHCFMWDAITNPCPNLKEVLVCQSSLTATVMESNILNCLGGHCSLQWRHNEHDGVSNHQPHDCLLNRLFKAQIKENIKAPRHWPLCGEFTGHRWIPAQRTSNAENVSMTSSYDARWSGACPEHCHECLDIRQWCHEQFFRGSLRHNQWQLLSVPRHPPYPTPDQSVHPFSYPFSRKRGIFKGRCEFAK